MIHKLQNRLRTGGAYPWLGGGAAIVILVFGLVAYLGSQRTTPNTGDVAGPVAVASLSSTPTGSATATPAAASASPSATPAATVVHAPTPTPASQLAPGQVLADKSVPAGTKTWQSQWFSAPSNWTISYTYDCGGNGGRFTVAAFTDTTESAPIQKRGDKGSGSVVVPDGGRFVSIAVDTTTDCAWHVTARA